MKGFGDRQKLPPSLSETKNYPFDGAANPNHRLHQSPNFSSLIPTNAIRWRLPAVVYDSDCIAFFKYTLTLRERMERGEEDDERREASIASAASLRPNFKPKSGLTPSQLSKFQVYLDLLSIWLFLFHRSSNVLYQTVWFRDQSNINLSDSISNYYISNQLTVELIWLL